MFNQNIDTKVAVLKERLSSYETMMKKIDEAIQLMGKSSQNISQMLAVHDERIEMGNKTDDTIIKMIDEMREENKQQHASVSERIEQIEAKIEEFIKFRWIIVGIFAVVTFAISQSSIVVDILTPDKQMENVTNLK